MAGHSHAKNVMHKKNAQDLKKAKIYVKISKIISTAVKIGGGDGENNYKLKHALKQAQIANVPKHVIQKAIDKQKNNTGETLYYEAYFESAAILIQTNSENKNKTAANIKEILSKNNAKIATPGAVMFLFEEKGIIEVEVQNFDIFLEDIMSLNVLDVVGNVIYVKINDFYETQIELEKKYKIINASIEYIPNNKVEIENKDQLYNLLEKLEEYEETESCWHNCKI